MRRPDQPRRLHPASGETVTESVIYNKQCSPHSNPPQSPAAITCHREPTSTSPKHSPPSVLVLPVPRQLTNRFKVRLAGWLHIAPNMAACGHGGGGGRTLHIYRPTSQSTYSCRHSADRYERMEEKKKKNCYIGRQFSSHDTVEYCAA